MRILPLLLLAPTIGACAATGPAFDPANLPKGDGAKVVIYRPPAYSGAATGWNVNIENTACNLHYGSFWARDGLKDAVHITAEHWAAPGTTRLTIPTDSRNTYYVRLEVDGGKTMAGVLGGIGGYLAAEGMASNGGPFTLTVIQPEQAQQELQSLRQESGC